MRWLLDLNNFETVFMNARIEILLPRLEDASHHVEGGNRKNDVELYR